MASISQQVLSFLLVVACLKFKIGNGTKQQNIYRTHKCRALCHEVPCVCVCALTSRPTGKAFASALVPCTVRVDVARHLLPTTIDLARLFILSFVTYARTVSMLSSTSAHQTALLAHCAPALVQAAAEQRGQTRCCSAAPQVLQQAERHLRAAQRPQCQSNCNATAAQRPAGGA